MIEQLAKLEDDAFGILLVTDKSVSAERLGHFFAGLQGELSQSLGIAIDLEITAIGTGSIWTILKPKKSKERNQEPSAPPPKPLGEPVEPGKVYVGDALDKTRNAIVKDDNAELQVTKALQRLIRYDRVIRIEFYLPEPVEPIVISRDQVPGTDDTARFG